MFVTEGDRVVLVSIDEPQLRPYIDTEWDVEQLQDAYHPASAIISRENLKATVYIRNLEVVPPECSPFKHGEKVKIQRGFFKSPGVRWRCNRDIVGMIGHVRGYDTRSGFYHIRCQQGRGWFPLHCLLPVSFSGAHFYYPNDWVKYKGQKKIVANIKSTKFGFGQLLLVDGLWVPSTDVEVV